MTSVGLTIRTRVYLLYCQRYCCGCWEFLVPSFWYWQLTFYLPELTLSGADSESLFVTLSTYLLVLHCAAETKSVKISSDPKAKCVLFHQWRAHPITTFRQNLRFRTPMASINTCFNDGPNLLTDVTNTHTHDPSLLAIFYTTETLEHIFLSQQLEHLLLLLICCCFFGGRKKKGGGGQEARYKYLRA